MSAYQDELIALRNFRDGKIPYSRDTFRQAKKSTLQEKPTEIASSSKRRNSIRPIDRAALALVVAPDISSRGDKDSVVDAISDSSVCVAQAEESSPLPPVVSTCSAVFQAVLDQDNECDSIDNDTINNTSNSTLSSSSNDENKRTYIYNKSTPNIGISSTVEHDRLAATVRVLMETLQEQTLLRGALAQCQERSRDSNDGHDPINEKAGEVQTRLRGALLELERTVQKVTDWLTDTSLALPASLCLSCSCPVGGREGGAAAGAE